jgi:hypothetical protein
MSKTIAKKAADGGINHEHQAGYLSEIAYDYLENNKGSIEPLIRAINNLTKKEKELVKQLIQKLNEAL